MAAASHQRGEDTSTSRSGARRGGTFLGAGRQRKGGIGQARQPEGSARRPGQETPPDGRPAPLPRRGQPRSIRQCARRRPGAAAAPCPRPAAGAPPARGGADDRLRRHGRRGCLAVARRLRRGRSRDRAAGAAPGRAGGAAGGCTGRCRGPAGGAGRAWADAQPAQRSPGRAGSVLDAAAGGRCRRSRGAGAAGGSCAGAFGGHGPDGGGGRSPWREAGPQ